MQGYVCGKIRLWGIRDYRLPMKRHRLNVIRKLAGGRLLEKLANVAVAGFEDVNGLLGGDRWLHMGKIAA